MTVTHTNTATGAFAKFTWNDDLSECSFVATGAAQDDVQAMVDAKAHEGADFAGYACTVAL